MRGKAPDALSTAPQQLSTRRYNAFLRHTKEGFIRRLPKALTSRDEAHAWADVVPHYLSIDGKRVDLVCLLQERVEPIEFLAQAPVAGGGGERACHIWRIEPIDDEEVTSRIVTPLMQASVREEVARWLVGSFDLVQSGIAGEPLDPNLHAPKQLLSFDSVSGEFAVAEVPFEPLPSSSSAAASASSSSEVVSGGGDDASILAGMISGLVNEMDSPPIIVLDLDGTSVARRVRELRW